MEKIQKIHFPYFLDHKNNENRKTVVFFGCDFYNLPLDSDREKFIEKTNEMLGYIRRNFEGCTFVYQQHPNETDEDKHLNLEDFKIGEKTIAELFLYENADKIAYVFSACSGASISAYAMGFESAVFVDTLHGALSEETLLGYRSYFGGLPESFFIKSFDDPLLSRTPVSLEEEKMILNEIVSNISNTKKVWAIASDPALGMLGFIILKELKKNNPSIKTGIIMISHRRWNLLDRKKEMYSCIDEFVEIPEKKIWYSLRPRKIIRAIHSYLSIKKLNISQGDTLLSFAHPQFEENCILSYFTNIKKILFIEKRWYQFVYENGYKRLLKNKFSVPLGVKFFNYVIEPLLHLQRSVYKQYDDGKVLNIFRYKKNLDQMYDKIFVTIPMNITDK